MIKTFDSHCHLVSQRLQDQVDLWVTQALEAGVQGILNVGCDWESSHLALTQASRHPHVFAAVGVQPHDASTYTPEQAEALGQLAQRSEKVIAIGEIGLDGHYTLSPMTSQIECFRHFLSIAQRISLPVLVHMRETFSDVVAGIQATPGVRGVIHCFTGGIEEARAFLDMGFYISFSGIVTFRQPSEFQDVVRFIPEDRILVETDAPYLAPKPHRGQMNRPEWVVHTCLCLAAMRGADPKAFADVTLRNTHTLFPKMVLTP